MSTLQREERMKRAREGRRNQKPTTSKRRRRRRCRRKKKKTTTPPTIRRGKGLSATKTLPYLCLVGPGHDGLRQQVADLLHADLVGEPRLGGAARGRDELRPHRRRSSREEKCRRPPAASFPFPSLSQAPKVGRGHAREREIESVDVAHSLATLSRVARGAGADDASLE